MYYDPDQSIRNFYILYEIIGTKLIESKNTESMNILNAYCGHSPWTSLSKDIIYNNTNFSKSNIYIFKTTLGFVMKYYVLEFPEALNEKRDAYNFNS